MKNIWTIPALTMLFACFSACNQKPPVTTTLPDDKIARIMADICIADAATNGLNGYAKDSLMQVYFKQVFEIHQISPESYEQDLRILAADLGRLEKIVKQADAMLLEGKNLHDH